MSSDEKVKDIESGRKHYEDPSQSSAYEELLDAKEKLNNPLAIPVTAGPGAISAQPSSSLIDGAEYPDPPVLAGVAQTSVGPEVARSADPRSSMGHYSQEVPGGSSRIPPVQAIPITSAYNQVASAELVPVPEPKAAAATEVATESEEEKVMRLRTRYQRYKFVKLLILLAILVVVVAVPLAIRSQRLNSASTPVPSGSNPCFQSYDELESAVDDYLSGGGRLESALQQYGSPIGSWCITPLQGGIDQLFSASRNPNAAFFNDPLYYWDTSNLVSMRQTFQGASAFSQPLGMWNVSKIEVMTSMFDGASNFRQDLCTWRAQLSNRTLVHNMFLDTSCVSQEDPELGAASTSPFCTPCS